VLSGIDEHTYVPKAAEIAQRMNIDMTLSGMFSKLIPGFNNQPKMSKSLPDSSIWVTMSLPEIEDMILNHDNGYTDYNDSIVFQLMNATFIYSDEEMQLMAKHCAADSEEWRKDKLEFSKKLFELCRIWQNA
jgi:tryptophanyl-tRNA synthetase